MTNGIFCALSSFNAISSGSVSFSIGTRTGAFILLSALFPLRNPDPSVVHWTHAHPFSIHSPHYSPWPYEPVGSVLVLHNGYCKARNPHSPNLQSPRAQHSRPLVFRHIRCGHSCNVRLCCFSRTLTEIFRLIDVLEVRYRFEESQRCLVRQTEREMRA